MQSLHLTSFLLYDLWRGEKRTFKIKSKFWQNESDRLRLRQAVNLPVAWTLFFWKFLFEVTFIMEVFFISWAMYSTASLFFSKCHYNVEVELYTLYLTCFNKNAYQKTQELKVIWSTVRSWLVIHANAFKEWNWKTGCISKI